MSKVAPVYNFLVTIICWTWFTLGFIIFFSWRYLAATLFARETEISFQCLNSRFYKIFFRTIAFIAPQHRWDIDRQVATIRSAVIICNHLSYLDPLLLISLLERHRTIVKSSFFGVPVFGWVIRKAGYFPAATEGPYSRLMIQQMENMASYLEGGGNLFIFPEGKRSRDGMIGNLNRGAFKIARLCKAPIYVLLLSNTDKLFTPGKFLFNANASNTISLKIIDCIEPDYWHDPPSVAQLEQRVYNIYSESLFELSSR